MSGEFFGKNLFNLGGVFGLRHLVELEPAVRLGRRLDDPGTPVRLVPVGVRQDHARRGLLEKILKGVKLTRRAEPAEHVLTQTHLGAEVVFVSLTDSAVDAVRSNN